MINDPVFYREIVELQGKLAADLDSEHFPEALLRMIGRLTKVENVLIVGADGEALGPWAEKSGPWGLKRYSLDVIRKAIASDRGWHKGGMAEEEPSLSQVEGKILSCIAARVELGGRAVACVYCDIRSGSRVFSDEDAARLKQIADCCAVYVAYMGFRRQEVMKGATAESPAQVLDTLLIGQTREMQALKSEIVTLAPVSTPILILGETGTGKEVVARAVHNLSPRAAKDFVPVHCAAINTGVFESELFGHERGAFSGAYKKREGKILQADGGTLFLDEIGDIPPEIQVKLLRVLEDRKVTPVGSDFDLPVDFRLVCATNKDLRGADKPLRDDFYYRVADVQLRIPPLRKRLQDVPLLARHFAFPKRLADQAIELLESITEWPGNVRQLRKIVENACMLVSGNHVPREVIAKQLEYQQMLEPSPPAAGSEAPTPPADRQPHDLQDFAELKKRWQDGDLQPQELEQILNSLYIKARNNWRRVGNQLGLKTSEELKAFRNWIYYLQKTDIIHPPRDE